MKQFSLVWFGLVWSVNKYIIQVLKVLNPKRQVRGHGPRNVRVRRLLKGKIDQRVLVHKTKLIPIFLKKEIRLILCTCSEANPSSMEIIFEGGQFLLSLFY